MNIVKKFSKFAVIYQYMQSFTVTNLFLGYILLYSGLYYVTSGVAEV